MTDTDLSTLLLVLLTVAQAVDLYTTAHALRKRYGREASPLLRALFELVGARDEDARFWMLTGVKVAVVALVWVATPPFALLVALVALYLVICVRNVDLYERNRK